MQVLYIAIAGALGAVSRFLLSGVTYRLLGSGFPYGTLCVNVIGSLLIGFIMQVGLSTDIIPQQLRIAMTVGFLGAFTTFSSIIVDTADLIRNAHWLAVHVNLLAQNFVGLLSLYGGVSAAKALLP